MTFTLRTVLLAAMAMWAAYIPPALWLQHRYQRPWRPSGRIVAQVIVAGKFLPDAYTYIDHLYPLREFEDTNAVHQVSPLLVYENDKLLGPAHSQHTDVEKIGGGRYSHWKGIGLLFSTSDNTDPRKNGRIYWAVVP
jgi:hypothetical protein